MIKFEKTEVQGFEAAIRGMRNPMNSWQKSDSEYKSLDQYQIGDVDRQLCRLLIRSGPEHCKFLRHIVCWTDITAPRFWWTEFDTYRFGVEKNSCSTMHTLTRREIRPEDFTDNVELTTVMLLNAMLEDWRREWDTDKKKVIWRRLIENLPQSYLQKRTVMMSYQALRTMCSQRKGHKLVEWHDFIDWTKTLPESWLILDEDEKETEHEA